MVRMASMPLIWNNLAAVGIEVRGELQDWPTLEEHAWPEDRKIVPDDFDTYLMGWSLSIDPDAAVIWSSKYEHPDGYNGYGYKNEEADALWEEGVKYVDPEKRKEIYYELEKILAEELPTIFLYNDNEIVAVNDRVKGVTIVSGLWDYAAKVFFDIYNVWIEE
jgi:peptide/nickel transport system substrate-binding protein